MSATPSLTHRSFRKTAVRRATHCYTGHTSYQDPLGGKDLKLNIIGIAKENVVVTTPVFRQVYPQSGTTDKRSDGTGENRGISTARFLRLRCNCKSSGGSR